MYYFGTIIKYWLYILVIYPLPNLEKCDLDRKYYTKNSIHNKRIRIERFKY